MNTCKAVRQNLARPLGKRVSLNSVRAKAKSGIARLRGNMVALLEQIHREEKTKLDAIAWVYAND